jgi:hypothetical protein
MQKILYRPGDLYALEYTNIKHILLLLEKNTNKITY